MALTETEKGEALFYLSYPAKTMVVGSIDYSRRIMERFENIPDHLEVRARKCMTKIRLTDDLLDEAATRFAISKVDGIEPNPEERQLLIAERKRYILQLSYLLDIPAVRSSNLNVRIIL